MAEAAEAREKEEAADEKPAAKTKAKAKKPAARKTTRRVKDKAPPRRMMMWAVYNGNMKEEARFPYAEREAADEKIAQLREKSTKKLFFIQPIKVPLGDAAAPVISRDDLDTDDEPKTKKVARDEEE